MLSLDMLTLDMLLPDTYLLSPAIQHEIYLTYNYHFTGMLN